MTPLDKTVFVQEMFNSVNGEVNPFGQGVQTTFVRLAKCTVNCKFCDTIQELPDQAYGRNDIFALLGEIKHLYDKTGVLCVTGGEPLLQRWFVRCLGTSFLRMYVETSGCLIFRDMIEYGIPMVVDYKLTSSEAKIKPRPYDEFSLLLPKDVVKFVIGSREDFEEAAFVREQIIATCPVREPKFAFSLMFNESNAPIVPANLLLQWLGEFKITNAILNVQLHKLIGLK